MSYHAKLSDTLSVCSVLLYQYLAGFVSVSGCDWLWCLGIRGNRDKERIAVSTLLQQVMGPRRVWLGTTRSSRDTDKTLLDIGGECGSLRWEDYYHSIMSSIEMDKRQQARIFAAWSYWEALSRQEAWWGGEAFNPLCPWFHYVDVGIYTCVCRQGECLPMIMEDVCLWWWCVYGEPGEL